MPRASSVNTTRAARRITYFAIGAALLSIPTLAIADETFVEQATVVIPGAPLASFDISWIDATLHAYFLADRSNKAIDVIDTNNKTVTGQFTAASAGGFTGLSPLGSDYSGPNGVLTIDNHGNDHDHDADDSGRAQVWAGDGPKAACTAALAAANSTQCSTVKVLSYPSGAVLANIPTGGQQRADELCYDPQHNVVMIANDGALDLFVTFISTEGNNKVLGKIYFNGTDPKGKNLNAAAGGIEQCQWNPRNGLIYLNLPSTDKDAQGDTVTIDPVARRVVNVYPAGSVADNCQPAGMAIGPDHQILLGCGPNANNVALVMFDNGSTIDIPNNSGSDEVWFNPGDGHYFLAESKHPAATGGPQLGVVDSRNDQPDQNVLGTGTSSHSVAADPRRNQAYVPINAGSGTLCGAAAAQGCVAIFGPNGRDDVFVYRDHDHDHH